MHTENFMEARLQSNIWKYGILLVTNKRVFIAILGAYYLTIPDVTVVSIGIIILVANLASFIFEIPSGYFSDKIGHKTAIVLSRILLCLSSITFLVADSLSWLILAGVLLNIGVAFFSGTGDAFLHETLRGLKRDEEYARVSGKLSAIGFAIPIALTVSVPFLVEISFKIPFVIALLSDIIGLYVASRLMVPPVSQEEIQEVQVSNFRSVMRETVRLQVLPLLILSSVIGGIVASASMFRTPYQVFLEIPVIWYGVLYGAGRAGASILLAYSGKIKKSTTLLSFYRLQIFSFVALFLLLGLVSVWWVAAAVLLVINAIQWGMSQVDQGYLIEQMRGSRFKATILSVGGQIRSLIIALGSFVLGFSIEKFSYQHTYLLLVLVFLLSTVALYMYVAQQQKKYIQD